MTNIREILAKNMKENRQRLGITQSELAKRANISTNFVAMIELKHKFPGPDTLDSIAGALCIDTPELFSWPNSPQDAMKKLQQAILNNLDKAIGQAVDRAIDRKTKNKKKTL